MLRKCVGAVILNEHKKIFLGQRSDNPSAWQLPQGGMDDHEKPVEAIKREMLEEIGTDQFKILKTSEKWRSYILPEELLKKVKPFWGGGVTGQTQLWFLCKLEDVSLINLNTSHAEFSHFKWAEVGEVMKRCVDFKKPVYKAVLKEFCLTP